MTERDYAAEGRARLEAMREQDARDLEQAKEALDRFRVWSSADFPPAEEQAYLIGYKDALRDMRAGHVK